MKIKHLLCFIALCLFFTPGKAQQLSVMTLRNGATVYIWEDKSKPDVFGMIAFKVGSVDDPEQYTGLAHYLEHVMFKGTQTIDALDWEKEKPIYEKIIAKYDERAALSDPAAREAIDKEINDLTREAAQYAAGNEFSHIICGGSPCQDLSVAGARAGLSGARSGLFMEQVRLVKEMRNADEQRGRAGHAVRPRYMLWENVPGAFSSGTPKGEDFRIVLEEIVRVKCGSVYIPGPYPWPWQSAGRILLGTDFSLAWRCLDAQYWGVAQRRKRIFLVADFAGRTADKILFTPESMFGDPTPSF